MHDKTLLIPLIPDLSEFLETQDKILLGVGEFVNLSISKILESLDLLLLDYCLEDLTDKCSFVKIDGVVKCYNCEQIGPPGIIYSDPLLHSVIVTCSNCNSTETSQVEGREIIILK